MDKYKNMNEVIFHDPIPMKYLCTAVITYEISSLVSNNDENSPHKYFKENDLLPKFPIYNEEEPDMTKIPFLCYPYEMNCTGYMKLPLSSKEFYIKMAKMSNIKFDDNDNDNIREKIIEKIREKIPELYINRHLIKLDEFYDA